MELLTQENLIILASLIASITSIVFVFLFFKRLKDLMRGISNIINWIKPSFEDTNGHSSSRRLTAFAIVITYITCRFSYAKHVNDSYYLLAGLIVDALFTLLLFGIVTFQQVLALKDNLKNGLPNVLPKKLTEMKKEDDTDPQPSIDTDSDPKKM